MQLLTEPLQGVHVGQKDTFILKQKTKTKKGSNRRQSNFKKSQSLVTSAAENMFPQNRMCRESAESAVILRNPPTVPTQPSFVRPLVSRRVECSSGPTPCRRSIADRMLSSVKNIKMKLLKKELDHTQEP